MLIQEDPGNVAYVSGIYAYRISDGKLKRIMTLDPAIFADPTKQDEESSGIIDTTDQFGAGTFLFDVQAHNTAGLPPGTGAGTIEELVENGQLLLAKINWDVVWNTATHRYVPVTASRLLDTRSGTKPVARATINVPVVGKGGVPATAKAVVVNLTATEATAPGFVTVWPGAANRPNTSNLNLDTNNQTRANQVVVPLGTDGAIQLYTEKGTHLIVDVLGYFEATETSKDGRILSVAPTRLLDTRPANKLASGATVDVTIAGKGGVPATGAKAALVNLTATETTAAGFFAAYPSGTPWPGTSNLNASQANESVANLALVPLGADGKITVFSEKGAHIIVDVFGYVTDSSAASSAQGLFVPLTPTRGFDSRSGVTPAANSTSNVAFTTFPDGVAAVFANVTMDATASGGYVTAYPGGLPKPATSTVNASKTGQTVANSALIGLGKSNDLSLYTDVSTNLIVDVFGWLVQ
jgi:hypothetical protein